MKANDRFKKEANNSQALRDADKQAYKPLAVALKNHNRIKELKNGFDKSKKLRIGLMNPKNGRSNGLQKQTKNDE